MQELNFPPLDIRTKSEDGILYVFDPVRRKHLFCTPEEWVRQHIVLYMINYLGYPKSMIRIEGGMQVNQLSKRSDLLVYDQKGKPWMIVECKAFNIRLDEKILQQVSIYNSVHNAPFVLISNGMNHFCFEIDHASKKAIPLKDIPSYQRD